MRNQLVTDYNKNALKRCVGYLVDIKSGDGSLPLSFDTDEMSFKWHVL